ncbi:DUF2238 domain-containing protein [Sulfuriferula sp. GW1]|uniref:DUF2238 domain-containing protein n=1 Tax=Sulfuriferula sp. GW1 TaxID=3345111 RepID=UPI0039AEF034
MNTTVTPLQTGLLFATLGVLAWSGIQPHDYFTWLLEVMPVLIALPLLIATRKAFPLTPLVYMLIALHGAILMVGGHYTYAEVPLFNWLRDTFDLARNHYDRVGHFAQGLVPALVTREILLRCTPLQRGKMLFFLVVCVCLAISATYELIEWGVAEASGSDAVAFLATQGDIWDTQKDMAFALLGSILGQLGFARLHDHQLRALTDTYRPI